MSIQETLEDAIRQFCAAVSQQQEMIIRLRTALNCSDLEARAIAHVCRDLHGWDIDRVYSEAVAGNIVLNPSELNLSDDEPTQPQVCIGCTNYHGGIYNGILMVCAMHPYGVDGDSCSDRAEAET